MKKLLTVIVVGLLANVAAAQNPGFDILGTDPVGVPIDGTADILIAATSGNSGGMSLALQALGNFEIVGLKVEDFDNAYWAGKINGAPQIDLFSKAVYGSSYAIADVSTSAGNHVIPDGALVALVTIAPFPGAVLGDTGLLTTDADVQRSSLAPWGDAEMTFQDSIGLVVTPEPMTALLLLGGLPLIRRRRA